jgi:hypothetical protein
MPHLRFRGCNQSEVIEMNRRLISKLSDIVGCPQDDFTIEFIDSLFVFDGLEEGNKYPFVEILWFNRDELKQQVVDVINEMFAPYKHDYVTVYFVNLNPGDYYENGKSF